MYHTPDGDRVLVNAERRLFTHSLAMIVDLLADDDMDLGVMPFDDLQRNQKLVVLCQTARALLDPGEPAPKLTAYIESAVAVVYETVMQQIFLEIDDSESSAGEVFWRNLTHDAAREQAGSDELPPVANSDEETWDTIVQCLADCVLWDHDYEFDEALDLPPEDAEEFRGIMGVAEDYYTEVPPDPPDEDVAIYLDALRRLTADAR